VQKTGRVSSSCPPTPEGSTHRRNPAPQILPLALVPAQKADEHARVQPAQRHLSHTLAVERPQLRGRVRLHVMPLHRIESLLALAHPEVRLAERRRRVGRGRAPAPVPVPVPMRRAGRGRARGERLRERRGGDRLARVERRVALRRAHARRGRRRAGRRMQVLVASVLVLVLILLRAPHPRRVAVRVIAAERGHPAPIEARLGRHLAQRAHRGRRAEGDGGPRMVRVEVEQRVGLGADEVIGGRRATAGDADGLGPGVKFLRR
jgi:hypothetical protein